MDEISSRVFSFYADVAQRRALPMASLVDGLPSVQGVLSGRRWYDWEDHVVFLDRFAEACGGAEEAQRLSSDSYQSPVAGALRAVAGSLATPQAVYRAAFSWFGASLYRHLRIQHAALSGGRLSVVIEIPEPHRTSETFFRMWRGTLEGTPRMLNLPSAHVEAQLEPRRARFVITPPSSRDVFSRLRRRVRWVLGAEAIVEELRRHEEEMGRAFEALVESREERRVVQEQLRAREALSRALLSSLPDLVIRVAGDGKVLSVEGSPAHALAPFTADLAGQPLHVLGEHTRGLTGAFLNGLLAGPRSGPTPARAVEVRLPGASAVCHLEWRAAPFEDSQWLCVVRDVTVQKRLEAELHAAERLATLGVLASGVGHDINNPLAYIRSSLEILRRDAAGGSGLSTGSLLPLLDQALEGTGRVTEIVRELAVFAPPVKLETGAVDVNRALEASLRWVGPQLRTSVRVIKELGATPLAAGQESRLSQVFVNLLLNAVQAFSGVTGRDNEIRVRTRQEGAEILAEVADTGCGMDAAQRARIFEPFFSTKAQGVGLGLAICQRIVAELGGRIEVESDLGRGSVFRVFLPVARQTSPPAPEVKEPDAVAGLRVLIVDDEPSMVKTTGILLRECAVVGVTSGPQALAEVARAPFDVILCDLAMPGMSGADVYRELAQRFPGLESRMVFMTGGALTAETDRFLREVPALRICKPFSPEELCRALAATVSRAGGPA